MLCPGLSNSVVRGSPWRVIGRGTIFFSGRPGEWGTRIPHLISLSLFEAFFERKECISFTVLAAFHTPAWNFIVASVHIKKKKNVANADLMFGKKEVKYSLKRRAPYNPMLMGREASLQLFSLDASVQSEPAA